ncbi:YegS/Rv2252/BmrU family lipid kinase [Rhodoplanes sp. TEM]|uniref:YegS/Rv2252/BmrU family lipid kinase n=1 Tax=Rhodoplanes tepidamans TaxID=200616 RepID=A0ABT5JFH7_RHOTP|nr:MULTISPECIES: YegS/Rv2252/BmrU family lipid kinase [Rhodoplanes]MDC7788317.1 YegS/Rv2252/BmrU family lipid kinase [Rhodoplanes tepidamans]MDC7986936.1 YegS/Rv2252/BmrU family lipid kinase [Rhodoplanes sp. TEM]MDQ0358798.1 YegS/Rv2252/BmrU family lipid kinase [Rhodoplanes tepidamans]
MTAPPRDDVDVQNRSAGGAAAPVGAAGRRVALIVNARSRRGRAGFETARRLLVARGFTIAAAHAVADPATLPAVAADVVAQAHDLVVIGGGDGTISTIVGAFAHRDGVLGLLPLGTANSFVKALGLPLALDAAVDVLCDGTAARVDLGVLDGRHFANAVAIGLPADIARGTPHGVKRWIGRSGYLMVAAVRLARHRAFRCTITHDGGTTTVEALDVRIANGGFQGGVAVAPEAGVDTGDLLVRVIRGPSRRALVRTWRRALFGRPPCPDDNLTLRSRAVAIATETPRAVSIDGEVVARTPVRAAIAPGALRVMVPRPPTQPAAPNGHDMVKTG